MTNMNDIDLAAIRQRNDERRARKEKATRGPWDGSQCWRDLAEDGKTWLWGASTPITPDKEQAKADSAFVAAARNDSVEDDVAALLAEVDRLRKELLAHEDSQRWDHRSEYE